MRKELLLTTLLTSVFLIHGVSFAGDLFMWPEQMDEAQLRACRKETRTLQQLQKNDLLKDWPPASDQDKIVDQFDLNGDGICELYTNDSFASGTGGYAEGIFQKRGNDYILIAGLFGYDLRLAEKKNGYAQLIYHHIVDGRDGETEYPALYLFNGKEYVQVKTPRWNRKKYNAKGVEKYQQKDYKTAELYFINALRVRTLSDQGYDIKNNLALCYIRMNNCEKAEKILNKILVGISNDSGYASDAAAAYFNLGQIYERKNDLNKSLLYYKKSLNSSPSDSRRQKVREIENRVLRRAGESRT